MTRRSPTLRALFALVDITFWYRVLPSRWVTDSEVGRAHYSFRCEPGDPAASAPAGPRGT